MRHGTSAWAGRRAGLALLALLSANCTPSLKLAGPTPPVILTAAASAGLDDKRARFREVFCALLEVRGESADQGCNRWLRRLEGEGAVSGRPVDTGPSAARLRIRIVPGIFGECAEQQATPFLDAIEPRAGAGYKLAELGYDVAAFRVSGRSSSAANAEEIRGQIRAMNLATGEKLVLIGHSKGMSDIIETLAGDRSMIPPGSAIVSLSGVVAGTPIADVGETAYKAVAWFPLPDCPVGDQGGVTSLTRRARLHFMARHPLPEDLRYYSIAAFTSADKISSGLRATHAMLSQIDERNDGNVLFHDSILPRSTVLAYPDADHWAIAMPFETYAPRWAAVFASRNQFPRVILLEAIARIVEEDSRAEPPG